MTKNKSNEGSAQGAGKAGTEEGNPAAGEGIPGEEKTGYGSGQGQG